MRLTESQFAELHQVLQGGLAPFAVTVELVEIDDAEERKLLFASAHARDVELVDVEGLQFRGQEARAEGRFASALFGADEEWCHGIGALAFHLHPLGGHCQHPSVEAVQPYGGIGHTSGQFCHSVSTVPLGQVVHIMSERVEVRYLLRTEQSAHVLVPAVDARCLCLDAEGVQHALVH